MNIYSLRLLVLDNTKSILDDYYLMASSKVILGASASNEFTYKNTPKILEDTLSNIN